MISEHVTRSSITGSGSAVDESAIVEAATEAVSAALPNQRSTAIWRLVIIGILLAFIWFLAFVLYRQNTTERRASGLAPNFAFTTFAGEKITLDDLKGKGVVLNFWASWCDPCRAEAALLEAAWRTEKEKGIVFVGLDYLDQDHKAKAYLQEFNITYPNGPDLGSKAYNQYGARGVPETFFISPQGEIKNVVVGPLLKAQSLQKFIDQIRP